MEDSFSELTATIDCGCKGNSVTESEFRVVLHKSVVLVSQVSAESSCLRGPASQVSSRERKVSHSQNKIRKHFAVFPARLRYSFPQLPLLNWPVCQLDQFCPPCAGLCHFQGVLGKFLEENPSESSQVITSGPRNYRWAGGHQVPGRTMYICS